MLHTILLIDDDDAFKMLLEDALRMAGLEAVILHHLPDGVQAVRYLSQAGDPANGIEYALPSLVLLDLKMPDMEGFDLLQWRKERPELKRIPFVVLSSSDLKQVREKAQALGADLYLLKQLVIGELIDTVADLSDFLDSECLNGATRVPHTSPLSKAVALTESRH